MHQAALHDGAQVHFQRLIVDITVDVGFNLKLNAFRTMNRADHLTVDYGMTDANFTFYGRFFGHNHGAGIVRDDVSPCRRCAIPAELDIAVNAGSGATKVSI
jgi:hypothetical protein